MASLKTSLRRGDRGRARGRPRAAPGAPSRKPVKNAAAAAPRMPSPARSRISRKKVPALAGRQIELERRRCSAVMRVGRRLEAQPRLAASAVEPGVGQGHARRGSTSGGCVHAARGALGAADLEDVGEVGGEIDPELQVAAAGCRSCCSASRSKARAFQRKRDAAEVDQVLREQQAPAVGIGEVGIGQVADQHGVVVAQRRAEQQRPAAARPSGSSCDRCRVSRW